MEPDGYSAGGELVGGSRSASVPLWRVLPCQGAGAQVPRCWGPSVLLCPVLPCRGAPGAAENYPIQPDKPTRTATGDGDGIAGGTLTKSVRPANRQGRWRARNSVMPRGLVDGFPWGKLRRIATTIGDSRGVGATSLSISTPHCCPQSDNDARDHRPDSPSTPSMQRF